MRQALSPALLVVAGLTAVGFALRLANFGQGLFADELSTAWIVSGHSLGHVLHEVRSNDEITPPLYFVLAWAASKLGSNPDLLRLPSLIAGTASIPLTYGLGARAVSRRAGLIAAAVVALSPFLIYYSTEARSYAVMIVMVLCAAISLLRAIDGGGRWWWVAYAVSSAGAMYSHYTAAFTLAGVAAWALWAHPGARRQVLVANAGALLLFVPWLPGFVADNNSPTTALLSLLQPFDFASVRFAIENWAIGFPYVDLHVLPGRLAAVLILAGVLLAVGAVAWRAWNQRGRQSPTVARQGIVLVVVMALATPVGEAIYSAVSTNVLGARNLNSAWPGLALVLGALIAAAPMAAGGAAAVLVLAGYGIGGIRATQSQASRTDYPAVASFIDANAGPHDVVVDAASFTPVPLTGLDVYLPPGRPEYRLGLSRVTHPFLPLDPLPDPHRQIAAALRAAQGHRIFLVAPLPGSARATSLRPVFAGLAGELLDSLPRGDHVVEEREFPALAPLKVLVIR